MRCWVAGVTNAYDRSEGAKKTHVILCCVRMRMQVKRGIARRNATTERSCLLMIHGCGFMTVKKNGEPVHTQPVGPRWVDGEPVLQVARPSCVHYYVAYSEERIPWYKTFE